jgi:nicotinate-nucleotide adenylyltransferase
VKTAAQQGEKAKSVKIGILGGTFNPIHFGHLRPAEEIRQQFKLSKIIFIPSAMPPHKDDQAVIDPSHRMKMVDLAITGNDAFASSDIEIKRSGKSYTIDTIRELKGCYQDVEFYFILGADAFLEINTWYKWTELFKECEFIVMNRPGAPRVSPAKLLPAEVKDEFKWRPRKKEFVHSSAHRIYMVQVSALDISSKQIREMVREGRSIRYLLPRRVMEYILEHQLYRK